MKGEDLYSPLLEQSRLASCLHKGISQLTSPIKPTNESTKMYISEIKVTELTNAML